jgi:hypothetical protein
VLLARITNIPGVFVVDRMTVPGGGFVRVDMPLTVDVVYIDNTRETTTISDIYIPPKRIARIFIPPGEKAKRFTINRR